MTLASSYSEHSEGYNEFYVNEVTLMSQREQGEAFKTTFISTSS